MGFIILQYTRSNPVMCNRSQLITIRNLGKFNRINLPCKNSLKWNYHSPTAIFNYASKNMFRKKYWPHPLAPFHVLFLTYQWCKNKHIGIIKLIRLTFLSEHSLVTSLHFNNNNSRNWLVACKQNEILVQN